MLSATPRASTSTLPWDAAGWHMQDRAGMNHSALPGSLITVVGVRCFRSEAFEVTLHMQAPPYDGAEVGAVRRQYCQRKRWPNHRRRRHYGPLGLVPTVTPVLAPFTVGEMMLNLCGTVNYSQISPRHLPWALNRA